jgi:hypothetical protein
MPTSAGTQRPTEASPAARFRAVLAAGLAALLTLLVIAGLVRLARPGYFGMNAATGQVAALADAIRRGDPPPSRTGPPDDAEMPAFRTTVYFPAYPALVAALRDAGLTWRGSLRAGSLLGALLLLTAAALAAWRLGSGRTGVLLAVALLASQFPFKAAVLAGRADLLAAGLSMAAFAAWLRDEDLRGWWAPLFAALAILVKATAVTVPLAMLLWALGTRRPLDFLRFGLRTALFAAIGIACTIPIEGPARYLDAARTILSVPFNTSHALRGPAEMLRYLGSYAEWLTAFAIAIFAAAVPGWRLRPAVWWIAVSSVLAIVVLSNRGADHNHLLELMAATSIVAGAWAAPRSGLVSGLAVTLIVVAVGAASWRDAYELGKRALSPVERRAEVVVAIGAVRGEVLAEDPLVAIAARRASPISDPGALRAMALRGDPAAASIARALHEGRYELVVLNANLERERGRWYRDFHLGPDIADAILERYRFDREVDGFFLYRVTMP